jgi:hypothetical protein
VKLKKQSAMKKSNKKKIETLLLYCSNFEIAQMLDMSNPTFNAKLALNRFTAEDEKAISKIKPLKQIVLILSGQFMKEHPRAGEPTQFREKILSGLGKDEELVATCFQKPPIKLHTIRADYDGWIEKIAAVNRGEAFLRVVTWAGEAYRSPWVDVAVLTKDDGIGVQKLGFDILPTIKLPYVVENELTDKMLLPSELAKNDGLSLKDFKAWFKGYDLSKPMAIIHFTKFRY